MTHERVIGSLRNSMAVRKTSPQMARQLRLLTDDPSPFFATFALAFAFFAVKGLICPQIKQNLKPRSSQRRAAKDAKAAELWDVIVSTEQQPCLCYNPRTKPVEMTEPSTPLMRQYAAIKKEHPSALLFFRLGDFYELFFDDAVLAAKELQITLTSRNKEKGVAIPMCGVPHHAAEGYISKLIRKGFKVAICEQVEDPRLAKKLVRREVTRVVTPGTAADSSLSSEENNFLAAIAQTGERVGFAALDLSTGEFRATEFQGEDAGKRIQEEIQQLRPKEVLYASSAPLFELHHEPCGDGSPTRPGRPTGGSGYAETPLDDWIFAPDHSIPLLENHFGVLSLEGFGLSGKPAAAAAAGAILYYVRSTQRGTLSHVDRIGFYERQTCLVLDAVTVRNLELIEPLFAGADAGITLFRSIDATVTPMGKRLLRSWLLRPSIEITEINARLDAVESQVKETIAREELRRALDGILDLERLLSRVTLETANPRDVLALAASLAKLPAVRKALERLAQVWPRPTRPRSLPASPHSERLTALHSAVDELTDLRQRIESTIIPEPPISLSDGGVIQPGVDPELDQLRDLSRNSKQFLAQIEQRERQRTGIASLKVKFNSIFGYYLEISKANSHLAPPDYERKQTLVNAERFTTPELKEYESKILDAQEKIVDIERRLFAELRSAIAGEARRIRQTALALAEVDVLAALAQIAALRNYCRPKFDDSADIEIVAGRHPVIEQLELGSGDRFVPNDLFLNSTTNAIMVLTGPNMGGKSTYLQASRAHRDHGAGRIIRARAFGPPGTGGSRVHPHRRQRQPGPRPLHFHDRDDGNRRHPAHRNSAVFNSS